jgi:hypothetical protein
MEETKMKRELEKQLDYATAIVKFTGLGMVCANEGEENILETLFVHAKQHKLDVKIRKAKKIGHSATQEVETIATITTEDFVKEENFWLHSQVRISISSELGETSKYRGLRLYKNDDFDRSEKSDPNDFGWLINLNRDRLLGEEEIYQPIANTDFPRSLMTIENCLIYTEKLARDKEDVEEIKFIRVIDSGNSAVSERGELKEQKFGKVADWLGAAVFGSAVTLTIEIGGVVREFYLPKSENPYIIEISNVAEDMESDMDVYRTFWAIEGNRQFNLMTDFEIDRILGARHGESVGVRKTCALAAVKLDSIFEMLRKPQAK